MQWIITAGYFLSQMVSWEEKTQIGGFVIVCDTKGFGFRQFKAMGWSDLKFVFMLIQVWLLCSLLIILMTYLSALKF